MAGRDSSFLLLAAAAIILNGDAARGPMGDFLMEQHQGAIVDNKGQPLLVLHVSMRISGSKWKGIIESPAPVAEEARPVQDKYYQLRLDDGREKTIHIGLVTLLHSKHGDFFQAHFDSSGPPPKPS